MKYGLKIMIATLAVSTLLAACGSKGGDSGGSTNAAPAAPAWNSNFPAGFVGSGSYQGQVVTIQSSIGAFYQMAGMLSSCGVGGGIGFGQSSYLNLRVVLRSNTGNGYVGTVGTTAGSSIGGFAISGGSSVFSRNMVYTTGSPSGFTLSTGICNQYNNAAPPAAGEPSISINGQFTDQTMSVLNVQVYFTSAQTGAVQIASGQLFGNPTGGYGNQYGQQPGYGYQQPGYGYGYGGGYTVPVNGGGAYFYYRSR